MMGLNHECSFARGILFNFAILNVSGLEHQTASGVDVDV